MSEETKGKLDEGKGKVKKAAGDLSGDEETRREGKVDETAGKARQAVSDVSEKAGDAVSKLADTAKGAVGKKD